MNGVDALIAQVRRSADCRDARAAWARQAAAAWRNAHRELDERLGAAAGRLSEAEFERLCGAEFARVDAMMAELRRALDEDKWPRELHFGGI